VEELEGGSTCRSKRALCHRSHRDKFWNPGPALGRSVDVFDNRLECSPLLTAICSTRWRCLFACARNGSAARGEMESIITYAETKRMLVSGPDA
jgi:hypothetical protein